MPSSRELFYKYLGQTSPAPLSLEIVSAQGVWMQTSAGRRILDFISGIAVSNVGHSHPAVIDAVRDQASSYMHTMVYGEFALSPQVRLAERLCSLLPPSLSNVYFVNSGAEAVEGALKLARRITGRPDVVAFRNAYHGSTQGALSACGNEGLKQAFRPLVPGFRFARFNQPEDLSLINSQTAAVIIEPMQGEAGVILPDPGFLASLRSRCNETGALLLFDEIQTAFGRTGSMFAFEHDNAVPDILVLGKALGGGMPLGAFIASPEHMSSLTHDPVLGHITTFGGHPVSCAASLAALDILTREQLLQTVPAKELLIRSQLHHPLIRNVRGKGLFLAVEFDNETTCLGVTKACLERGLLTDWFLFAPHCMRIAPPLVITEEEINQACRNIHEALDDVAA